MSDLIIRVPFEVFKNMTLEQKIKTINRNPSITGVLKGKVIKFKYDKNISSEKEKKQNAIFDKMFLNFMESNNDSS